MAGGADNDDDGMIAGINVTPLVDITLVLLIIFIVTARIIVQQAMPMDLPKAASGKDVQTIFSVELMADGRTFVNSEAMARDADIALRARDAKAKKPDVRAVIRAETRVEHGRVIGVLDLLNRSGIDKIAFAISKAEGVPVEPERPKAP